MKMEKLTQKQMDILDYVSRNGKTNVEVNPRLVCQNKNFYDRVRKLEELCIIDVERREGYSSLYSITETGRSYLQPKGFPGIINDFTPHSELQKLKMSILVSDVDKCIKEDLLSILEK